MKREKGGRHAEANGSRRATYRAECAPYCYMLMNFFPPAAARRGGEEKEKRERLIHRGRLFLRGGGGSGLGRCARAREEEDIKN